MVVLYLSAFYYFGSTPQRVPVRNMKSTTALIILCLFLVADANVPRKSNPTPSKGNVGGVHDGHRLITRALWRIFDAIMEKKNHDGLYGRIKFMEGALDDMLSSDSRVLNQVDALTVEK